MKRFIILIAILGFNTTATSQVFEWVTSIEQVTNNWFFGRQSIASDNNGDLLTAFSFEGTIDVDPGVGVTEFQTSGAGNMDICIRKLNEDGMLLWGRHFETTILDFVMGIATGSDQSTYAFVGFGSTVDLDPGVVGGEENAGRVLFKLDDLGAYQWSKQMATFEVKSFLTDADDNILIGGLFVGNVDFDPGLGTFIVDGGSSANSFLLKLNASGDFQWVKTVDSGRHFMSDMALDPEGNIYITGWFNGSSGSVDFDPGAGVDIHTSYNQYPDFYIQKFNAFGEHQWAYTYGGSMHDDAVAIAVNEFGDVYISGTFMETVDFNPGSGNAVLEVADQKDMFLQKLNTQGEFQWVKQYSNPANRIFPEDLICDSNGDVYLAGRLDDPADDNDPFIVSSTDIFVYKLNVDGSTVWEGRIEGRDDNFGATLVIGTSNELYISGIWSDTTDFDPTENTHLLVDYGVPMFITKWNAESLNVDEIPGKNIRCYPNPVTYDLTIDFGNEQKQMNVKIYDLMGKLVHESEENGVSQMTLDLSLLESGVYCFEVSGENHNHSGRVVKK